MLSKYSKRRQIFIISLILFIVIDLLFLIIITLPTTRGFYESSGSSNVEVKIAGWNFLVNGKKEIEQVEIDLSKTLNEGYEKIIPGSSGVINLDIDTTGTDVTMKCKIEMVEEETNKPKNIKLYKDSSYQEEIEDGYEFIIKYDEDKTEKKIYWKWEYTEEDEKEWMEKEIKIKLNVIGEQIIDEEDSILYKKGTLAYEIIKNAMKASEDTERTIYSPEPLTKPAQEVSGPNERTLSVTEDDYGESYYYRGNVQDNYLNFNEMCWRIVRIEGDGSIKLILEDKNSLCENATGGENASIGAGTYGYTGSGTSDNPYIAAYELGTAKSSLDNWINNIDKTKLKEDNWCLGNQTDWYDENGELTSDFSKMSYSEAYKRWAGIGVDKHSSLFCNSKNDEKIKSYVSLLTLDEVLFAGMTGNAKFVNTSYLKNSSLELWLLLTLGTKETMSNTTVSETTIHVHNDGVIWRSGGLAQNNSIIPSIVLQSGIKLIEGDGTKTSPYKV